MSFIDIVRGVLVILLGAVLGCGDGDADTKALRLETLAGGSNIGDGGPATATFLGPLDVGVDEGGNVLMVDRLLAYDQWIVRRIDARSGVITTPGGACLLDGRTFPQRRSCDLFGISTIAVGTDETIFIEGEQQIFRIDPADGRLTHVAGGGYDCDPSPDAAPVDACNLYTDDMALDRYGRLYLAWAIGGNVRRLDIDRGTLAIVAGVPADGPCRSPGDGVMPATEACIRPYGIAIDHESRLVLTSDDWLGRVDLESGELTTLVGNGPAPCEGTRGDGGPLSAACFVYPTGVAVARDGTIFVADSNRLRRVDLERGTIATVADGVGDALAAASDGSLVFTHGGSVDRFDPTTGVVTHLAGNGTRELCGDGGPGRDACIGLPRGVTSAPDGGVIFADERNARIGLVDAGGRVVTIAGGKRGFCGEGGFARDACFRAPSDVVRDHDGNLYVADSGDTGVAADGFGQVRRIDARTGIITTVAGLCIPGLETARAACLVHPRTLAAVPDGALIVGGELGVRRIDLATDTITSLVGGASTAPGCDEDGMPAVAACVDASDVALDAAGDLYLIEAYDGRVRRVDATGRLTTVAGNGFASEWYEEGVPALTTGINPTAIMLDGEGGLLVASGGALRRVDLATGRIRTVAGSRTDCFNENFARSGCLFPFDLERDELGRVIGGDVWLRHVVRITLP